MLQNRLMPCLLIKDGQLVKTERFRNPVYVGDPVNAIKIFNRKEVDELIVLDISSGREQRGPDMQLIHRLADECFMPVCYGGGITNISQIREILKAGVEKVVIGSAAHTHPELIAEASDLFGSQCIIVSVDVKKNIFGKYQLCYHSGSKKSAKDLDLFLFEIEDAGAGEILIHNLSREGTWNGFDLHLINRVSRQTNVPVIALGGAGNITHIESALTEGGASAVAIGSMAVYQKQGNGVLISFPDRNTLNRINQLKQLAIS